MARVVVRSLLVCVAALAARPAAAAPDEISRAAASRLATLRSSIRTDRGIFEKALSRLSGDLAARRVASEPAAASFQGSLTFLLSKVDAAADAAADGFVEDVSGFMSAEVDVGANAGDGGAFDRFAESARRDLASLRRRLQSRARGFAKAFTRAAKGNASMNTVFPDWTFDLPGAPTPAGPVPSEDAPLELRVVTAARLTDGRLVLTAAGNADRSYGGQFDLRIRSRLKEDLVGSALSAGGLSVGTTGFWSVTTELGDPFRGDVPPPGNRVLHFGVEPTDVPVAGIQPGRLLRAGVFMIP